MLLSTSVTSLVNGVSQQPEGLRFSSQCSEQVNWMPTVLRGLSKRPPTKHISALGVGAGEYRYIPINRSPTEQYVLVAGHEYLKVFDLTGTEYPVKNAAGGIITTADLAYLQTSSPTTSIKALTVADYTFILNRDKQVALASTVTTERAPEALVFVKQVRDGADYKIKLYNTPSASSPSYVIAVDNVKLGSTSTYGGPLVADQGDVINNLGVTFEASAASSVYDHFNEGELMYVKKKDNSAFRIEVECSIAEGMSVFKDVVQSFSMLPKKGWNAFQLKVVGDPENSGDDYYLKFVPQDANTAGFGEGTWVESQKYGLQDQLDGATMPHVLLNFGTYFQFKPAVWASRTCGDAESNPPPSFVGQKIRGVFFHKNRLGLLTGENVVMSRASEYFDFWRSTVIQLLDEDVIDIGTSATKVSVLNSAVAVSDRLTVWADATQFLLSSGDQLFTPKTVAATVISEHANIGTLDPKPAGSAIYFPFSRGGYSGFGEYAATQDTGIFESYDLTEHVPFYLQGKVTNFDLTDLHDLLIAQTDSDPSTLYSYSFYKRGQQRLQSAWGKWQFGGVIKGFFIVESRLYLALTRSGTVYLEAMDLNPGLVDTDTTFLTYLDRRITDAQTTRTYDAVTDQTVFTLPYPPSSAVAVATRATPATKAGVSLQVLSRSGNTIRVLGNKTTTPLWLGESYSSTYDVSRALLKTTSREGREEYVTTGRFQVRTGTLTFADTLAFRVEVSPVGRGPYTYTYTPAVSGTFYGQPYNDPQSATKRFPVFSKNGQVKVRIVNDTFLPCNLLTLDWEALFTLRSQRA